jgi:hypothetical protein
MIDLTDIPTRMNIAYTNEHRVLDWTERAKHRSRTLASHMPFSIYRKVICLVCGNAGCYSLPYLTRLRLLFLASHLTIDH